jgi:hypothetical protein
LRVMGFDLFESPRLTIARARHHIDDLNARIDEFVSSKPWSEVIEKDSDGIHDLHKVKFARRLPADLPCIVFDAANNLRAVLDQSGYASAVAAGYLDPKNTQFPFGDNLAGLEYVIKRGRCKDLPPEILALFRRFKPCLGGNDTLWALNKLCNTKKHCALVPFSIGWASVEFFGPSGESQGKSGSLLGWSPRWDPDKYELSFPRPNTTANHKTNVALNVAFFGPHVLFSKPAVAFLREMMSVVDGIFSATEAECRRLGLVMP